MERNPAWLARKLGLTRPAVSLWLSGENMPNYDNLFKLGSVLDVDWETLIIKNDIEDSQL